MKKLRFGEVERELGFKPQTVLVSKLMFLSILFRSVLFHLFFLNTGENVERMHL